MTFCLVFVFEETRHATTAVVIKSSSFTKEEVLTTQNTANYSPYFETQKKQFHDLLES